MSPLPVYDLRPPDQPVPKPSVSSRLVDGVGLVAIIESPPGAAAVTADGRGLWVAIDCALYEFGLDGTQRHPPTDVDCATVPVLETPYGLWVRDGNGTALIDPVTLAERARFARADPIDDRRVLVSGLHGGRSTIKLYDSATGDLRPVTRPDALGSDPAVGPLSPDGRWLPVWFGNPSTTPQTMDLWVLDLGRLAWYRLPSMPVGAALKATGMDWSDDGRLVLLGEFAAGTSSHVGLLASWRPGEPSLAVLPYDRPPPPAYAPYRTTAMIVS